MCLSKRNIGNLAAADKYELGKALLPVVTEVSSLPTKCYKIFIKSKEGYRTPYKKYLWSITGQESVKNFTCYSNTFSYNTNNGINYFTAHINVEQGLHAYVSRPIAQRSGDCHWINFVIIEMTIPAGTPFIRNDREIVALKMIAKFPKSKKRVVKKTTKKVTKKTTKKKK